MLAMTWLEFQPKTLQKANTEAHFQLQTERAQNEQFKSQMASQQESHRVSQIRIAQLEEKVMEMDWNVAPNPLDPSQFIKWDWQHIVQWMMTLESGRFKKYESVLKDALSEAGMAGDDLLEVNQLDVKGWNVKNFKDQKSLFGHIQELIDRDGGNETASPVMEDRAHVKRHSMILTAQSLSQQKLKDIGPTEDNGNGPINKLILQQMWDEPEEPLPDSSRGSPSSSVNTVRVLDADDDSDDDDDGDDSSEPEPSTGIPDKIVKKRIDEIEHYL